MRNNPSFGPVVSLTAYLVLTLGSGAAKAGLILGFGQAGYTAAPGQGIDVPVYLHESGTSVLATEGLNSAGIVISFNVPPTAIDPARVTLITPNPGVNDADDFLSTSISPASGSTAGSAELLFSIVLSDVLFPTPGSSSILLGTYHFTAGATPGQVTNLSVGIAPGGPQFFSGAGQELDSMITAGNASISVQAQAVPEPSCLTLLASSMFCLAGYTWFGRKIQKF
jgi:hypothetical protein